MTKDVGTQTNNTLFELVYHDYSLRHTDYSKSIILESKIQEYLTQTQELKKVNMFFQHYLSRIKNLKVFIRKIKDDPKAVRFYTCFENYDARVAVFKCLEPGASKMHFW